LDGSAAAGATSAALLCWALPRSGWRMFTRTAMGNVVLLFACLAIGMGLRWGRRVPDNAHTTINAFIIHVSLPALTLFQVHSVVFDHSLIYAAAMPWLLFTAGALLFWAIGRMLLLPRATVGALAVVGGLGNTSFMGLPMIEAFYGTGGMPTGIVIDQLGTYLVLSTIGIMLKPTTHLPPQPNGEQSQKHASTSFLKKRSKKLLIFEVSLWKGYDSSNKSFLVLFFKKELLAYLLGHLVNTKSEVFFLSLRKIDAFLYGFEARLVADGVHHRIDLVLAKPLSCSFLAFASHSSASTVLPHVCSMPFVRLRRAAVGDDLAEAHGI